MKQFVFFLSLLFITINFYAQNSENTTQKKFENYLKLGFKYHDNRKLDSANLFFKKADSLVKISPKDSSNFYRKEVLAAALLIRENKPGKSVEKLLQAISYFKDKKDSTNIGISLIQLSIANYYLNRRVFTKNYTEEALLYKQHLSKKLVTRIYQNLGSVNLEEAIATENDQTLIYSAIKSYKKAIKIYQLENWITDQTLATSLLAECYNQLNDFDMALQKIDEAILLSKKDKNKSQEGFALIKKASFLANKKEYNNALKNIKIAKIIFTKLNDRATYLYALRIEKTILVGLKKYKQATIIGDSIFQISVENYDTNFAEKVAEMDAKYLTAEKEKEIFQQKKELLAKELKIKNRNQYAIVITAALLILGIVFFGIFKKNQYKRKQLQKEIDLKDALATIKTQNRLQEQRLRISRDLHDNIGAQLTFIISSLDNLKYVNTNANKNLKERLTGISSFTSETIHELRDTIWAMNKNKIAIEDLHARLLSFIEKAKKATTGIEFKINQHITNEISFTSLKGMHIFRSIQEAINNAIKYAEASKITITFNEVDNQIQIIVSDNGKGFDVKTIESGNGLNNMETRMNEINGQFSLDSNLKNGTKITFLILK